MELRAGSHELKRVKDQMAEHPIMTVIVTDGIYSFQKFKTLKPPFTSDPGEMTRATGITYLGRACDNVKHVGIVEISQHRPEVFYTSRTFVHEVSHQGKSLKLINS